MYEKVELLAQAVLLLSSMNVKMPIANPATTYPPMILGPILNLFNIPTEFLQLNLAYTRNSAASAHF